MSIIFQFEKSIAEFKKKLTRTLFLLLKKKSYVIFFIEFDISLVTLTYTIFIKITIVEMTWVRRP